MDTRSEPKLTEPQEADLIEYGAVSPLAIVALLLGVASAAALASVILLLVPILAVVLAMLALAKIARSEGALVGRSAALAGLALALLFTSLAVSQSVTHQLLLRRHAREFADDWLELVRAGDLHLAHQLHLPAGERQLPESDLGAYYTISSGAGDELAAFLKQPPLDAVIAAPADAQVRFVEVVHQFPEENVDYFEILYELVPKSGAPTRFVVVTQRIDHADGGQWRIVAVKSPSPEDEEF